MFQETLGVRVIDDTSLKIVLLQESFCIFRAWYELDFP